MSDSLSIAILILAAGASRRMGRPKQLLKITPNQTLIEHAIHTAQVVVGENVLVILGANAALIKEQIAHQQVSTIVNKNWQNGMGTSLKTGLAYLVEKNQNLQAILIAVCDQPYLEPKIFQQIIDKYHSTQAPIICSDYGSKLGVPALLTRQFFPELLALQADEGARRIIQKNSKLVKSIPFPQGSIDLDTPEAYHNFYSKRLIK